MILRCPSYTYSLARLLKRQLCTISKREYSDAVDKSSAVKEGCGSIACLRGAIVCHMLTETIQSCAPASPSCQSMRAVTAGEGLSSPSTCMSGRVKSKETGPDGADCVWIHLRNYRQPANTSHAASSSLDSLHAGGMGWHDGMAKQQLM